MDNLVLQRGLLQIVVLTVQPVRFVLSQLQLQWIHSVSNVAVKGNVSKAPAVSVCVSAGHRSKSRRRGKALMPFGRFEA